MKHFHKRNNLINVNINLHIHYKKAVFCFGDILDRGETYRKNCEKILETSVSANKKRKGYCRGAAR